MYDLQTLAYSLLGAAIIAAAAIVSPYVPRWWAWAIGRYLTSSTAGAPGGDDTENDDNPALSLAETNSETAETPQRVAEIRAESFTLGETAALARLVAAGKLGLTDAVKIGAEAKSGEKYQRRSREIKAAVEQLQQKYRPLTDDQRALREQPDLPPRR